MNDGTYTVEITMTGGSGKAYINSPVTVTVTDGEMIATLEWSSPNYDMMIVDGKEFLPVNESGNSVFEIPVYTLDEPLSVQAETLAMSEPHLIDYVIEFDSSTLRSSGGNIALPIITGAAAFVCIVAVMTAALSKKRTKKKND